MLAILTKLKEGGAFLADEDILRRRDVLPIGTVINLTTLTARQIRYYEEQGLVKPSRNAGNHRMYSLNDVDSLIQVMKDREAGMSLADIKRVRAKRAQKTSDSAARRMLQDELLHQAPFGQSDDNTFRRGF